MIKIKSTRLIAKSLDEFCLLFTTYRCLSGIQIIDFNNELRELSEKSLK